MTTRLETRGPTMDAGAAADRASRAIGGLGAVLLSASLLLPVGDAPWFSFWREWAAAIAVLLVVLGLLNTLRALALPLQVRAFSLPTVAVGLAALCWLQLAAGLLHNHSDALLASAYLIAFALCGIVAESLPGAERAALADRLALALLGAALLSVPLAILQWVGWLKLDLGMTVAGGRPVAHMEQTNLLCSLLIQGVLGAWRLAERRRIGPRLCLALCGPMLATMVLTQSRVAWLASLAVVVALVARHRLVRWRSLGPVLVLGIALLLAATVLLPSIDAEIGVAGTSLADRTSGGHRPIAWALFLDAVAHRPWAGWGVLQNGNAQYALAAEHPALGETFSSAHNIVIDLMVWFGAPVGLLAGTALLWTIVRRVALAPDRATLATALAAAALVLHALVELPLHYLYFALPLGLLVGLAAPRSDASGLTWRIEARASKLLIPLLALAAGSLLALLPGEYLRITDVRPVLAVDQATKHLKLFAVPPLPDVMLLDQLANFHALAATPAAPGLNQAQLRDARSAMLRQPYPAAIEHYALVAGRNGLGAEALEALAKVCQFETPEACTEGHRAWSIWRLQWPELPAWNP